MTDLLDDLFGKKRPRRVRLRRKPKKSRVWKSARTGFKQLQDTLSRLGMRTRLREGEYGKEATTPILWSDKLPMLSIAASQAENDSMRAGIEYCRKVAPDALPVVAQDNGLGWVISMPVETFAGLCWASDKTKMDIWASRYVEAREELECLISECEREKRERISAVMRKMRMD